MPIAHQPGSEPIEIPEQIPNPAVRPTAPPNPEKRPERKEPAKVPDKVPAGGLMSGTEPSAGCFTDDSSRRGVRYERDSRKAV